MKHLVVLLLLGCAFATKVRYDNFKVYRVTPKNEDQLKSLRTLEETNSGYSFWSSPSVVGGAVDIMVPPHMILDFEDFMKLQNIDGKIFIEDVQEKINRERNLKQPRAGYGWTDYYRLDDIYAWLDSVAEAYPDKVKVIIGGESYEGRQIKGVHVSFSSDNENKAVFIEGGIHAREWITPAVVTYILNEVLTSTDSNVREIVEAYDWYVFPNVNPDGYEYTHTDNRLWRKTRVPYGSCYGADPNRNWGYEWMNGGASNNPCSETYAGSSAFSEPCTKTLSEFITSISDKLVGYLAFHSYSQLLLIPYGHTSAHLDNYDELMEVGAKAKAALAERYGTKYTVGNIVEAIYVASGGSMDWVKGNYKTPMTYTWELRDQGQHGFLLPAEQIIPTGEETFDSVLVILQEFNK